MGLFAGTSHQYRLCLRLLVLIFAFGTKASYETASSSDGEARTGSRQSTFNAGLFSEARPVKELNDVGTGMAPDKMNVSTSKGWKERRERVAANIERFALDLFVKHGYPGVTIESVANAVGCSVRTVTRQFPTKEDLLLTFHRRKKQAVLDEFARLAPSSDPVSAIWAAWMNMAFYRWRKQLVESGGAAPPENFFSRRDSS